jgi:uncharacterized protein (TIGR03435 family)
MKRLDWSVVLLLVAFSRGAIAQTKAEFEVASIRPSAPDERGTSFGPGPGGGIIITNFTLKEMIRLAWQVQPFQISGGPAWLDSIRYDVTAKPQGKPQLGELLPMLRSLLEDRFQLAIHRETRELPIYALVVVGNDGKLGPGLTESKENSCTPPDPSRPPSQPKPGEPAALACGGMMMGPRSLTAASVPIANLPVALSRLLGRTVVDKTGLKGKFDIRVEWTSDETQAPPGTLAPPSETAGPPIFTALQEQLGLKLETQTDQMEILVVERAEKPSAN